MSQKKNVPMWFKITNEKENHHDYKYEDGLNILEEKFNDNPKESCCKGGLYFTNAKYSLKYIGYGVRVRVVTLPTSRTDFKMVKDITGDKWRANMIILNEWYALSNVETFKFLVKCGADIHVDNDYALCWAAAAGYLDIVKYLVENGANVHVSNDLALRRSAKRGHFEIVKFLVENGANVSADDDCAVIWAAKRGHLNIVEYLAGKGANVHAGNNLAFLLSAEYGHLPVVKYLVECRNPNPGSAWNLPCIDTNNEEYRYFWSVLFMCTNNNYALRWSAQNGHLEVVQYLVECGADIHADDECALNWSARYNHPDVFNFLVKKGARMNTGNNFIRVYSEKDHVRLEQS